MGNKERERRSFGKKYLGVVVFTLASLAFQLPFFEKSVANTEAQTSPSIIPASGQQYNVMLPLVQKLSSLPAPLVTGERKIIGSLAAYDPPDLQVLNDSFFGVTGTDLGAVTKYNNRLYFALGDTVLNWRIGLTNDFTEHVVGSSPLAFSKEMDKFNLDQGVELEGYAGNSPAKAIDDEGHIIPNALFTIHNQNGQEYMFSQYMNIIETEGNDHHINYAGIARFNGQYFVPYKPDTYRWPGNWRHFGMASFWPDYNSNYLYMVGSPSGRFGGVKLAKIPLTDFLDSNNTRNWEYLLEDGWSIPTHDTTIIQSAKWLIPPKDPEWTPQKDDWDNLPWSEQCEKETIAEFSVIYNPYLQKFMLLTSNTCIPDLGGGVHYYTASNIEGPWSKKYILQMPQYSNPSKHIFYGIYTTDALLQENGRIMYFLSSNWDTYGIYMYRADFH